MFYLAVIPKLALFLIIFFVTILIISSVVLLRVVFREEAHRKQMDQDAWAAKINSSKDSQVQDDKSSVTT